MIQIKMLNKLFALIFIGGLLISCSSQDQPPIDISETFDVESDEKIEVFFTETPTVNQEEVTTTVETDLEDNEPIYTLDWKINNNEVMGYKTAMNPVDNADSSISFNFDQLVNEDDISDEIRQQLSDINLPETFSMISILERNPQDNISVKMIVDEIDMPKTESGSALGDEFNQLLGDMKGTVQLRGELTPDGAISSFYLEQNQRNLLAMFFELPTEPVQVGDHWSIDVNCIAMGNGFIAKNADQINRVEFTQLTENAEGKPLAVLDYLIVETVDGDFQSPMSDEAIPTSMECSFLGQGLFLIEEGRWEQLTGEFAINATGIMDMDAVQHFALTPLENIPEEYIGLK